MKSFLKNKLQNPHQSISPIQIQKQYNTSITFRELITYLHHIRNTSPGLDNIHPLIIKKNLPLSGKTY